jgi:hypothetical protein
MAATTAAASGSRARRAWGSSGPVDVINVAAGAARCIEGDLQVVESAVVARDDDVDSQVAR